MNKYAGLKIHDRSQHMKNSEAKEKVCPFIQDAMFNMAYNDNVDYDTPKNIMCICEKCMAWKVTKDSKMEKTERVVDIGTKHYIGVGAIEVPIPYEEHEGFCKRLTND